MPFARRAAAAALALVVAGGLAALTPSPTTAAGRTLYVATDGRDYASDGWSTPSNTIRTPWRTIAMTIRRARPGDTIVVRGGTYQEVAGWGAVKGTATAPIRLEGYPGERVVLKGVLQLAGADHWVVRRINVTHDPELGRREMLVKFDGGVGWQFLDSEVWGTRGVSNVMVVGSSTYGSPASYRIAGNCIHDNDATGDPFMNDHNLYLQPGYASGPGLIERNIFFNAENGAHIKAAGGVSTTGSAHVVIRYNTMVRGAAGVIVGYGSHHTTMWRNLVGAQVGGSSSYNAAYLGNHVSGAANTSTHLAVWGYPKSVRSTSDSTRPITSSETVWVRPAWDSTTACSGFHPTDSVTSRYGRYSP